MAFYGQCSLTRTHLGQISNIYFKDTTVITINLKDSRLPCSGAFHLSRARQGTMTHRSWPKPLLASVPKYLKVGNNIGWCIVGRQAIWWEGVLVLNLHIIGATRTSQIFSYYSWGWMIQLVKARWSCSCCWISQVRTESWAYWSGSPFYKQLWCVGGRI